MAKSVFYSFHYRRDVFRVQLIRNISALEGQPELKPQEWEQVKARGDAEVKRWIDKEMSYKRAVIVLIGRETSSRRWVRYEVERAWDLKKPLLGVYIHGLSGLGVTDQKGLDPFLGLGLSGVRTFDPTVTDWKGAIDTQATHRAVRDNLAQWAEQGTVRT